jgi:prepilin-type N-terminal cleavage/methylation domain-containing protein
MNSRNTKKGFTLLELLIVIAVLAILTVALLPAIRGVPAKARDAQRTAFVSTIVKAVEQYASDTQVYPDAAATGECLDSTVVAGEDVWPILDPIVSSGVPDTGPKEIVDVTSGANALCPSNEYFYKDLTDGYVVAVEVESCSSANVVAGAKGAFNNAALTTVTGYEALLGTPPSDSTRATTPASNRCIYAVVQST